jgi:hypothetical protein
LHTALFALLSLATSAHAQQPITLNVGEASDLKTLFVVEDTTSKRFADTEQSGKVFISGDRVQVLSEADGWVRIMKGNTFGWVPEASLSVEAPAPAIAEEDAATPSGATEGTN